MLPPGDDEGTVHSVPALPLGRPWPGLVPTGYPPRSNGLPPGREAGWGVALRLGAQFPGDALQPKLLPELVGDEARVPGAQAGVGVRQGPEVGQGELRRAQGGVHVRLAQHRLRQLRTLRLRKQQPGEGKGRSRVRGNKASERAPQPCRLL